MKNINLDFQSDELMLKIMDLKSSIDRLQSDAYELCRDEVVFQDCVSAVERHFWGETTEQELRQTLSDEMKKWPDLDPREVENLRQILFKIEFM